jgi:hypothetical protein
VAATGASAAGGSGAGSASGGGHGGRPLSGRSTLDHLTHRTLIVVRRARLAGAKAIWRSFLPEVPPA